jgi:hypothetical protein
MPHRTLSTEVDAHVAGRRAEAVVVATGAVSDSKMLASTPRTETWKRITVPYHWDSRVHTMAGV